ncbi:MAG: hypothetical protein ACSLE8_09290, partial [Rhodococcus sp. (in: high G+C Gram-positive bacteria)]
MAAPVLALSFFLAACGGESTPSSPEAPTLTGTTSSQASFTTSATTTAQSSTTTVLPDLPRVDNSDDDRNYVPVP